MVKWKTLPEKQEIKLTREPQVVLNFLQSRRNPKTGKLEMGFGFFDFIKILTSCLEFNKSLTYSETENITNLAISNILESSTLTEANVLREVSKLEKSALHKRKQEFLIATNISLQINLVINIRGSSFSFFEKAQDNYDWSWVKQANTYISDKIPKNYGFLITKTVGKSASQAIETSMFKIDRLRAIMNLYFNKGRVSLAFGPRSRPMNAIFLGPVQTLHNTDGSRASDYFWFDENCPFEQPIFKCKKEQLVSCIRFLRSTIGVLEKYDKGGDLARALRLQYCNFKTLGGNGAFNNRCRW
jgi:hypothetical protein